MLISAVEVYKMLAVKGFDNGIIMMC